MTTVFLFIDLDNRKPPPPDYEPFRRAFDKRELARDQESKGSLNRQPSSQGNWSQPNPANPMPPKGELLVPISTSSNLDVEGFF